MHATTAEFDAYNFAWRSVVRGRALCAAPSVRASVHLFLREIFNEYLITISPRKNGDCVIPNGGTDEGPDHRRIDAMPLFDATIKVSQGPSSAHSEGASGPSLGWLLLQRLNGRLFQSLSICRLTFYSAQLNTSSDKQKAWLVSVHLPS